jgi:chitinase
MKKIFYLGALCLLLFQACKKDVNLVPDGYNTGNTVSRQKPTTPYVSNTEFKIVAYYSEAREPDSIELKKFKMITNLHYAFAYPNADGTIKAIAKPANFKKMKQLAKDNGIKFAVSIAGVSDVEKTAYETIVKDPSLRSKFITNIVNFAVANDLDGIDIDWEYPSTDRGNQIPYEAFMKALAAELHAWHIYLSAAVTPGVYTGGVQNGITTAAVEAMDFINIMAYDGGGYGGVANHSSLLLAQNALNFWITTKGIAPAKAVLGMPAYGKQNVTGSSAITYRDLLRQGASADGESFVVSGGTYYYNGIPLAKQKATLAKDKANGIMMWEFYQDANGDKSLLKAINDALGRSY